MQYTTLKRKYKSLEDKYKSLEDKYKSLTDGYKRFFWLFSLLRERTGAEAREISARICMSKNPLEAIQLIEDAERLL